MVTITESAQEYLAELLSKQEGALGVRVFINEPGTARAETCIAYCRDDDVQEGDEVRKYEAFTAWFDSSQPAVPGRRAGGLLQGSDGGAADHQSAQCQDAPG